MPIEILAVLAFVMILGGWIGFRRRNSHVNSRRKTPR
jgi:hypothetical protein